MPQCVWRVSDEGNFVPASPFAALSWGEKDTEGRDKTNEITLGIRHGI